MSFNPLEEKGIPIDVGSRYFRGHLLGRGEFLDQPFGTTEPEEAGYNGKASYFYDQIQNSAGSLLDNVTIPLEEWQTKAGNHIVALDGVAKVQVIFVKCDVAVIKSSITP